MLIHFIARRYVSAVYALIVCLSVRPSVCHIPVLYQLHVESQKCRIAW